MFKVIGMLVALAMFCAIPSIAFAGSVSTGNVGNGGDGGDGGDRNCSVAAGDDASCNTGDNNTFNSSDGDGDGDGDGEGDGDGGDGDGDGDGVGGDDGEGGGDVTSSGGTGGAIGGGSESVTLAQTGFDAWVLALLGGLSLAGGLGLLAAQRRGRLNA